MFFFLIVQDIYPEGGFFKSHKDTPHVSLGANHLGSLVVILPFPFTGGKLVIKQGHREEVVDANSEGKITKQQEEGGEAQMEGIKVKWAAFFGDCNHWIEPVTSGFRITLTYHLYTSMNLPSTFSPEKEPIYLYLRDLLTNNDIVGKCSCYQSTVINISLDGENYGFVLRHEYSSVELGIAESAPLLILRGSDAILYSAAISLELKVKFRAVFPYEGPFYYGAFIC